jgi:hypothetical protein
MTEEKTSESRRRQKQQTTTILQQNRQFNVNDPLWNETLELGPEGLIATVEDEGELLLKLKDVVKKRSNLISNKG